MQEFSLWPKCNRQPIDTELRYERNGVLSGFNHFMISLILMDWHEKNAACLSPCLCSLSLVTAFYVWLVLFCLYAIFYDVFFPSAQPRRWSQRRRISVSVLSLRAPVLCPSWRTSPSRSAVAVVSVKPGEGSVRPAPILDLVSHLFYFVNVYPYLSSDFSFTYFIIYQYIRARQRIFNYTNNNTAVDYNTYPYK